MKPLKQYILLIITATIFSCKENPPVDDTVANTIILTVEWTDLYRINVKWNRAKADTLEPFTYRLTQTDEQGNKTTKEFTIAGTDTNYTAGEPDSLQQGKSYWYKVEGFNNEGKLKDTSRTVEGKTLTPTSHDIVWQIDTLGQAGNFLYDVWGMDENNVYAVGAVNMPEGITAVIKWDGTKWNYHSWPEGGVFSIFGFSTNDIWTVGEYSNRGFIGHFSGASWTEYRSDYFLARGDTVYPLRAVWGSSPEDVWAVGALGTIIHWDGVEWKKVSSPTSKGLSDIYGISNNDIYALTVSLVNDSELLHYNGTEWKIITDQIPPDRRSFISLWFDRSNVGYIVGTNVLNYDGNNWSRINVSQDYFFTCVNGSNSSNVFIGGQRFQILHFNGSDWKRYTELEDNTYGVEIRGVQVFNNKVFLVGYSDNALVYIGTKQ